MKKYGNIIVPPALLAAAKQRKRVVALSPARLAELEAEFCEAGGWSTGEP